MTVSKAISLLAVITTWIFVAHLVFQQLMATNKAERTKLEHCNVNIHEHCYLIYQMLVVKYLNQE